MRTPFANTIEPVWHDIAQKCYLLHQVLYTFNENMYFLTHLTQRLMWGIVITWHRSSSVYFYILIFFSETTGPIRTKFERDGPLLKVYVFLFIRRNKRSNDVQKGCIYIYGYKLFIVHLFLMSFFFNAFIKKISLINMHNVIM